MAEIAKMNLSQLFGQTAQTLAQAEEKAKSEQSRERINRFRTGEDGTYNVRVLPLAPIVGEDGSVVMPMDRYGYEFGLRTQFIKILGTPDKNGKRKAMNIPVIQATQAGVGKSVDLIDEYTRIAKEYDDEEIADLVKKSNFEGGLRWNYQRNAYVIDLDAKKREILMWSLSNSQYKTIDDERRRIWGKLQAKNENAQCPLTSIECAYPLAITRSTENKKTSYTYSIDTIEGYEPLSEEDMQKLFDMPRICDEIYRFSRYQLEAELVFLKQFDEIHELDICNEPDFQDAVEKLKGELSADDTSHFSFSDKDKSANGAKPEDITLDSLWNDFDALVDADLDERSEEANDLKEKIRQFAEDNSLDFRLKHGEKLQSLLDRLEEAYENKNDAPAPKASVEEPAPEPEPADEPEDEPAPEPAPAPRQRQRPSRPVEEEAPAPEPAEDPEPEPVAEAPVRRRRRPQV